MKNYIYQNNLIGKKQLRQLLAWSFSNYDSMQACSLADELKYLGFKYASQAGISISIEDLKIPFVKNLMLEKANQEIINAEKIYLKGKITDVERFQKIIDTWSLTSESLKEQVIHHFKNYDPLNSVYIMAFSGARGNLSQVRQLVGMRGLMSDPSGEIMKLPIKKNFREGLTITDYLMSGYGARKGIVDTALKTANSGYLTRRLIDVAQDILIREKDCLTDHSVLLSIDLNNPKKSELVYDKMVGHVTNQPIFDPQTNNLIASKNTQLTSKLVETFKQRKLSQFYLRSPLTCNLYRAICQNCYGWDLATENLVDIGESIGIIAGQSIGEPGTQLTMRTFHTGGIFTSGIRQQIVSPLNGLIKFYKTLKTVLVRTNRGEDVLITKNSGSLILIPEDKTIKLKKIEILKNTILFPKNNQYILKDTVIGELINTNKQIKTEVKPIVSNNSGEIFIPRLKKKVNLLNNNKLLWILYGQLYNSPNRSFINFYPDYKLNNHSYIFRTKIVNHYNSSIHNINSKVDLYQRTIKLANKKYFLEESRLYKLKNFDKNYFLSIGKFKYFVKLKKKNSKLYLQLTRSNQISIFATNSFCPLTGGTLYYDQRSVIKHKEINQSLLYLNKFSLSKKYKSIIPFRTIIWLGEEIHKVNCEQNILLVEHGDFISKQFELIPGLYSKTSGIISISQKNNIVQTISIKSGLVYEGEKFQNKAKQVYFPGEIIFSTIPIKTLCFCERIVHKTKEQILVRPIELYEFPHICVSNVEFINRCKTESNLTLHSESNYLYKSNQCIKGIKNTNLILNGIIFNTTNSLINNINVELFSNKKTKLVELKLVEKLCLNNYISPNLRYKNLVSCFLLHANQFVDKYTVLGYLESITLNSLEIVKVKVKKQKTKQILLISNSDCINLNKVDFPTKKLNDFIINSKSVNQTGRIIIENENFLTLQKGRPYFFPNCKNEEVINKTNLQYKFSLLDSFKNQINTERIISMNYYDMMKLLVKQKHEFKSLRKEKISLKLEFSKMFLKRNGKLYSLLVPQFLRKFSILNQKEKLIYRQVLRPKCLKKQMPKKLDRTLLLQSSGFIKNKYKNIRDFSKQLTLVKFEEHLFLKTTKSVGLYSITEDYFEQDVNSVFCQNSEFIEDGDTIGLLNLEKEITGDIVQGLPRIEEILEARKKNTNIKRIPTSQKKGLLLQKTSLDPNFEFKKMGTSIIENEKINPHKLLKVYFNYYGLIKIFSCDRTKSVYLIRLINNYEASYKSFKKVQIFILNSVQAVYKSQGVSIKDKHLEVIIKQMTTKVLITHEGDTPLLRREVVDLYHIHYINQTINSKDKQTACYIPLLLGITKAALNNPSFISAASFQETTRVLTKAAIEGRIDWLRGLKENIIIGHLIPAGTGSQNYRNGFKRYFSIKNLTKLKGDRIRDLQQKS